LALSSVEPRSLANKQQGACLLHRVHTTRCRARLVAKDACCVNAMRSGAMLRAGGLGRCIGPRPRAAAHMAIRDARSPYAQEPALLARFTREGRAAAGLSHPNIVAGLRQRLRGGHAPSGHEGVEAQSAATAPASRCRSGTTRPAARPASWSPSSSRTPTSKSGGRSTASARSWSAAASSAADVLTGRAGPARVGAIVLPNPITRAVRWLTRFMVGRHEHSILWSC
jgi:hypothetical protein